MAIADPEKLYPKLEKDGLEVVRRKLAMGAYANYKVPLVREWIRMKEDELEQTTNNQIDIENNIPSEGIQYLLLKSCYYLEEWRRDQHKVFITGIILVVVSLILSAIFL